MPRGEQTRGSACRAARDAMLPPRAKGTRQERPEASGHRDMLAGRNVRGLLMRDVAVTTAVITVRHGSVAQPAVPG